MNLESSSICSTYSQCSAIYQSGNRSGQRCSNKAKWIVERNGAQTLLCGVHAKKYPNKKKYTTQLMAEPMLLTSCTSTSSFNSPSSRSDDGDHINIKLWDLLKSYIDDKAIGSGSHCKISNINKSVNRGLYAMLPSKCLNHKLNNYFSDFPLVFKVFNPGVKKVIIYRELEAMKKFNHPNIIRILAGDRSGIIMEQGLCLRKLSQYAHMTLKVHEVEKKDSHSFLEIEDHHSSDASMAGIEARSVWLRIVVLYLIDICNGLSYIHNLGYVHMDLKESNIIIVSSPEDFELVDLLKFHQLHQYNKDRPVAKLIDFGGCTPELLIKDNHILCTYKYSSPELMTRKSIPTCSHDLWSLGIIIHGLLTNSHPIFTKEQRKVPTAEMKTLYKTYFDNMNDQCFEQELDLQYDNIQEKHNYQTNIDISLYMSLCELSRSLLKIEPSSRNDLHNVLTRLNEIENDMF